MPEGGCPTPGVTPGPKGNLDRVAPSLHRADTEGSGRPIIFVHGWQLSAATEKIDYEPMFTGESGWRRVYAGLPAMGGYPPSDELGSLDSFADGLAALIEDEVEGEPFALAGTSMGGLLAAAVADRFEGRLRGLLLRVPMLTAMSEDRELPQGRGVRSSYLVDVAIDARIPGQIVELSIEKAKNVWGPARKQAAEHGKYLAALREDAVRYSLSSEPLQREFLEPALVLTGRLDGRVGYRDAFPWIERMPRATFAALDGESHVLPAARRELFEILVRDWLQRMDEVWDRE